ncbi:MAG TPA: PAS domain S-box protein, partial [Methanocellaceae archaeon]
MESPGPPVSADKDSFKPDEEKYRFLVENSADIIWTIDLDYKWRFITNNVERIIHIKAGDIIGKTVWDFVAPEYYSILKDNLKKRLRGEVIPAYEVEVFDGSGKRVTFDVKTTPIVDKKGTIIGIQGISRDVTDRKRNEEAVRKSEKKFRDLIENIYDWVWETDSDLVITYSSPRVMDYLGYRPEEVTGKSMYDFMTPGMAKRVRGLLDDMVRHHKQVAIAEKTMTSKRGEPVDFEMTVSLTYADDGAPKGFRGICKDIRDRKRADEARYKAFNELERRVEERTRELVHARATLQGILDTAPIGIMVADAETNLITFCSLGVERLFGHSFIGAIYNPEVYPSSILQPDGSPFPNDRLPMYLSLKYGQHVSNVEMLVKLADDSERMVLVNSAPIKDPDGRIRSAVVAIVDITKLKNTEKALQEAKDLAEMYLDLMGHDINNLNQVGIGYLEMALDALRTRGKLEIDDQLLLDKAMETIVTSSGLIDNVRKLQRSMEGTLKYQVVDLCEVLAKLKEYYSQIPNRDVTIRLSTDNKCFVSANELIRDVFSNLLDNAIKHTDPKKQLKIDMEIKNTTIG